MQKFYSENSKRNIETHSPKAETIQFLLNYSKALNVVRYKESTFDVLLN